MPIPMPPLPRATLGLMGAFGVYLFAFTAAFSVSLAYVGLTLFTLAFVAQGARLRPLLREPVVRVSLAFAAFVAVHSLVWYLQAPTAGYAHEVARTGADWVKLLLFIPLAWWLGGDPQGTGSSVRGMKSLRFHPPHIGLVLFLAVLGLALGFLRKLDWSALDAAVFTQQFVAYLQPLALGLFAGVGAIGLLVCRSQLFARVAAGPWRWLAILGYVLFVALVLEMLVLSFSRSAWLGFGACLVLWGGLLGVRALGRRNGSASRRGFLGGIAALTLVGAAVGLNLDTLSSRLGVVYHDLGQVAFGELEEVNPSSIALRVRVWHFAYGMWRERPWFGWGAGTSGYWIQDSGQAQLKDADLWLADLHNTYAELLFQFGVVGAVLFLSLVGLLVWTAARRCRRGPAQEGSAAPPCLCDLLLLAGVFVALWVLTDHRATNHDFRFFWMLLAGSAYALHLAPVLAGAQDRDVGV
jgi:O-antigen ligase